MSTPCDAPALRRTGAFDVPVVAALHERCFADDVWHQKAIAEILAMPGAFGLLALRGDEPAGFLLARVAADECEILSIGVAPEFRRRGVGRMLLRAVVPAAVAAGAARLLLEVAEDNPAALALYAAEGFQASGRRTGYYRRPDAAGADALLLSRPLP